MRSDSISTHIVTDGSFLLDGGSVFGQVPKVIWERAAKPDRKNRVRLGLNCLLVRNKDHNLLIDVGMGSKDPEVTREVYGLSSSKLLRSLRTHGLSARDIDTVLLSHLHFDHSGGALKLDAEKARNTLAARVAAPLDTNLLDCAYGVYLVACGTMVRAVKAVSTYRGRDPRDFALFTFGGSGPVVAAAIADLLEMSRIVVPPNPGVFSAYGLLQSDIEHEVMQAFLARLSEISEVEFALRFRAIESDLSATMREEGYEAADFTIARFADLRYSGQAHELTIAVADSIDFIALAKEFGDEHERTYGHKAETEEVESVALRVVASVPINKLSGIVASEAGEERRRAAFFGPDYGLVEVAVVGRSGLGNGPRAGPLIIEEYDATCVVPPDWTAALDGEGNIILTRAVP